MDSASVTRPRLPTVRRTAQIAVCLLIVDLLGAGCGSGGHAVNAGGRDTPASTAQPARDSYLDAVVGRGVEGDPETLLALGAAVCREQRSRPLRGAARVVYSARRWDLTPDQAQAVIEAADRYLCRRT